MRGSLASNVWFNLPGVMACYQPLGAPDQLATRQNVAVGKLGRYTATLGVAPTWVSGAGWTFNGSTQYLKTSAAPTGANTMLIQYSGAASSTGIIAGVDDAGGSGFGICPYFTNNRIYYDNTSEASGGVIGGLVAGNLGVGGKYGYRNGVVLVSSLTGTYSTTHGIYIGGNYLTSNGNLSNPCACTIQAFALYARILNPPEAYAVAWQMAFCTQNPDWNAWAARRRYYYMPASAAVYAQQLLFAEQMRVMTE